MNRDEMFKLINKERLDNIKKISKDTGLHIINNHVNTYVNTKNLDDNLNKNIEIAVKTLKFFNDNDELQHKGDVLYLSILHLIDSFCLLEEKRLILEAKNMKGIIQKLMGGIW
jgi:hypothetical protein